ncbi:ATP-binding cassette glutathione S-conjugate transporter ycf1 [Coemansia sp. RSA 487]|nr:ATP-binding cassette glutathione S-conjugate transporter ycf1 [Coemansia sp. RSA 487]
MSICGEVEMTKGTGSVVGSIALVEQVPWIMNGTLRENILFGREYDQEFYNKVIFSCALSDDISNWKNGDQTVIGERGINISGGQKARLALARAVYSRAEIYVLDDPLSAVDAHVKRHILDHVIMDSGLLAGKIRIMATHEEKLLPYFDTILQLDSKGNVTTLQQDACEYQPKLLDASTQLDAKTDNPESDNASLKSSLSEKPDDEEDCAAQVLAPLSKFILDGYKLAALKKDNSTGAEIK